MYSIVFIEDDVDQRKSLLTLCEDKKIADHYNIEIFPHPSVFLDTIASNLIDVELVYCVFLDMQLNTKKDHDRSGLNFVDTIRTAVGATPIVAFTYHTEPHDSADITSRDIDGLYNKQDFITKTNLARFQLLTTGWRKKKGLSDEPVHSLTSNRKRTPRILHLSDLQFGRSYFSPNQLSAKIVNALNLDKERKIDLVIISGDVAQTGAQEEYELAIEFLERIKVDLELPSDNRIIIAPGNHDISWPLSKGFFVDEKNVLDPQVNKGFVSKTFPYRMAPFYEFLSAVNFKSNVLGYPSTGNRYWIKDLRAIGLVAIVFNSSYKEHPFLEKGSIRTEDFEDVKNDLDNMSLEESDLIVSVFHHPLQIGALAGGGVLEKDIIDDPSRVTRKLWELGVSLVFTGHVHKSSIEFINVEAGATEAESGIINLLAGSASVPEVDRPRPSEAGHVRNEFAVVKMLEQTTDWEIEAYEFNPAHDVFLPCPKFVGQSHKREFKLLKNERNKNMGKPWGQIPYP